MNWHHSKCFWQEGSPEQCVHLLYVQWNGSNVYCRWFLLKNFKENLSENIRIKFIVQIQAGKAPAAGQIIYTGPIDCARQLLRHGGISSLYRGFGATFIRGAISALIQFRCWILIRDYVHRNSASWFIFHDLRSFEESFHSRWWFKYDNYKNTNCRRIDWYYKLDFYATGWCYQK